MPRHVIAPDNPPSFWVVLFGEVGGSADTVLECVSVASPLNDEDKRVIPGYEMSYSAFTNYGVALIWSLMSAFLSANQEVPNAE